MKDMEIMESRYLSTVFLTDFILGTDKHILFYVFNFFKYGFICHYMQKNLS
jgi:hypothetical protein